jgi:poly(3-hydroxybutyrate) depolymerase
VDPRNADSLAAQWTALHGLDLIADRLTRHLPGATRSVWERAPGEPVVESWTIDTLAHGFPVASELNRELAERDSAVGPWLGFGSLGFPFAGSQGPRFVQAVGIDAVAAIAAFWGLL